MASSSCSLSASGPLISTPEVLWHGGGNENGKPDPVYSVDLHPLNVLATSGIDANVPPKGSVRLWKVDPKREGQEFLLELNDHQTAVNCVRFSPCGRMLASSSDRMIVIYTVTTAQAWTSLTETKSVERIYLRPSLEEIYDLDWSMDSCFILAGAINNKAEIIRIATRDTLLLPGHTSYVQGVAWDPLNEMVVTQSADRSCKIHQIKFKPGMMIKLAPRGHVTAKMHSGYFKSEGVDTGPLTAADFEDLDPTSGGKSKNIYADSTVPSFFRRPAFSPDGALLITPTGINRPMPAAEGPTSLSEQVSAPRSFTTYTGSLAAEQKQTFCTHIFARSHLSSPAISLIGLEEPSVAVRCSPVLYKLNQGISSTEELLPCLLKGKYRAMFAVVTISAVMVYDTQHSYPIARFGGLHLACINDATWSADGKMLVVCSSDGYITFVRFAEGSLGEPIPLEDVPIAVKRALPFIYSYEGDKSVDALSAAGTTIDESGNALNVVADPMSDRMMDCARQSMEVIEIDDDSRDFNNARDENENEEKNLESPTSHDNAACCAAMANEDDQNKENRMELAMNSEGSAVSKTQSEKETSATLTATSPQSAAILCPCNTDKESFTEMQPKSEEKKRKRITPIIIAPLSSNQLSSTPLTSAASSASATTPSPIKHPLTTIVASTLAPSSGLKSPGATKEAVLAVLSQGSPSAAVVAVASRDQAAAAAAVAAGLEKKKKRITPILLSASSSSSSSSSSSGGSAGIHSPCPQ